MMCLVFADGSAIYTTEVTVSSLIPTIPVPISKYANPNYRHPPPTMREAASHPLGDTVEHMELSSSRTTSRGL